MPVFEQWKVIELNKLCHIYPRQNRQLEHCRINVNCKNCVAKSHALLHVYAGNTGSKEAVNSQNSNVLISSTTQCYSSKVLLSTALIKEKEQKRKD